MNRPFSSLTLTLIALLTLAACKGGSEKDTTKPSTPSDTLVIAFGSNPTNLDIRVGNDNASGRIFDMIYSGLVRITPDSGYAPDVAQRWETPDDRTIIFHLDPHAKFHDGTQVTAEDVKWTYDSLMSAGFDSPKKAGYAAVEKIEAPDPGTIVFRLREPNGGLFANLTLGILPKGSDTAVLRTQPMGAGPYRVVEFKPDERLVLRAFDEWHLGKPKITNVILRIIPDATTRVLELRRGSVDLVVNNIPNDTIAQFEKDPKLQVVAKPGAVYQYLAFNLRDPILKSLDVRRAIAHAIDRNAIVRDLQRGYGSVTDTMFPEGSWARAENLPSFGFDLQKAKTLLDTAGYPDPDGDGPQTRFKLVFKTSTDVEANQRAQMIQQMLSQAGIELEIQSSEFGTFYEDIQQGRFQIFSLSRAGVVDPDFYQVIFHSKSFPPEGQNRGYYSNRNVDALIEQGRSTFDREKRRAAYVEIQKILADELPYISLYNQTNVAVMKANLRGFELDPWAFLLSIPKMSIH